MHEGVAGVPERALSLSGAVFYLGVWMLVGAIVAARPKNPGGVNSPAVAMSRSEERKRLIGAAFSLLPLGIFALVMVSAVSSSPTGLDSSFSRTLTHTWAAIWFMVSLEAVSMVLHFRPLASLARAAAPVSRAAASAIRGLVEMAWRALLAAGRPALSALQHLADVGARAEECLVQAAMGLWRRVGDPFMRSFGGTLGRALRAATISLRDVARAVRTVLSNPPPAWIVSVAEVVRHGLRMTAALQVGLRTAADSIWRRAIWPAFNRSCSILREIVTATNRSPVHGLPALAKTRSPSLLVLPRTDGTYQPNHSTHHQREHAHLACPPIPSCALPSPTSHPPP